LNSKDGTDLVDNSFCYGKTKLIYQLDLNTI
jgi:hypothetical protein